MKKLSTLISDYKHTSPLDISKYKFAYYYALTKIFSFLRRSVPLSNKLILQLTKNPQPFLIENTRGVFSVRAYDDSMTICSNYFEEKSLSYLSIPATKDLFIDIGSNRGIYSITAIKKYGYNEVIACEPNPDTLKTLRENISQNNLGDKIKVIASGLSDTESKVNLEYDSYHTGGATIVTKENKTLSNTHKIIQIEIRPLDSIISDNEMERVSFMKIDVEGHEINVLRGGHKTLKSMRQGGMLLIESGNLKQVIREIEPYGLEYNTSFEGNHLFTKNKP